MKQETVKGLKDYTGKEAWKRAEIKKLIIKTFETYGFEAAETPIIEYEDFVKAGNKEDEVISDLFRLRDKGKRRLALRYEFTFQLKRLMKNKKMPYKRYQVGEVFRDEPVKSNRFRQFTQFDVDIVGSTEKDEAEVLTLVKDVFKELGIKNEILVGNRELLNEILNELKIRKNKEQILREIDKLDKIKLKEVRKNLKKLKADKILAVFKKSESYFKKYKAYKNIQELKKYCKFYGVKIKFQPSLVRGLSYYNRNVFEVKTKGMKETICAGGSYMFNKVQSTGISFGLDRITDLAKIKDEKEKILVISLNKDKEAIKLVKKLKKKDKIIGIYYGKPTKALNYANSYGFRKVIFVGKKEVEKKKYKVKDMKTGKESMLKKLSML